MSHAARILIPIETTGGNNMGISTHDANRYEEATASNMGIDMPEDGLTVAHVIAYARRTGTRAVSWLPVEVSARS